MTSTNRNVQVLSTEFDEFDRLIRPAKKLLKAAQAAHLDVRARIRNDDFIDRMHVADFLQGSYARHTMVLPTRGEDGQLGKADVDVIFVTNVSERLYTPEQVLKAVETWLKKEYGDDRVEVQSRSVKLTLGEVEVDFVPTSAPSEAERAALKTLTEGLVALEKRAVGPEDDVHDPNEVFGPSGSDVEDSEWASEPLRIPDRDARCWQNTHPLAVLKFTVQKNKRCDKRFLRIVRALKWWRRKSYLEGGGKHPKSYPIEHMTGDCCPETFDSVAEGLTLTFERMLEAYRPYYPHAKPTLKLRGLEKSDGDVISRLTQEDFNAFYKGLQTAASIARNALHLGDPREAAREWQKLLGKEFPVPPAPRGSPPPTGGFPPRTESSGRPTGGRFGRVDGDS